MKALQDALKQLTKREVDTFPAKVVSVDKKNGTCVVNDGEIDYTDVQLSATVEDNSKRFYLFPKVGSSVLVSPINEDIHRLYVEFFSEVESLDLKIEATQLQIDQDGFLLKRDETTFKDILNEILTELKNAIIQTPSGVGNFAPSNVAKFNEINNKVKQLFK